MQNPISQTLESVCQRINLATNKTQAVTLIAVSKTQPIEKILQAYAAGIRDFGENRTVELANKVKALAHLTDISWHFIGNLQTRQSLVVAEHADYFHALDRLKIAQRLDKQLQTTNKILPVFLQINITGEPSKSGFAANRWQHDSKQREQLIANITTIMQLDNLKILGLMTMAEFNTSADITRQTFTDLRQLSEFLQTEIPEFNAPELSMGMSGDFELAIAEGATYVRVGQAIFGERQ